MTPIVCFYGAISYLWLYLMRQLIPTLARSVSAKIFPPVVNIQKRPHIVETEPFSDTFGPKAQRKRPRLAVGTFEELSQFGAEAAESAEQSATASGTGVIGTKTIAKVWSINIGADGASLEPLASAVHEEDTHADYHEPIYAKGTSRRIYGELYKVIDSSDVVLHILDARDPIGTMCTSVLEYIKKEKAHKQVVLVINKCDLVPNWVTVSRAPSDCQFFRHRSLFCSRHVTFSI